MASIVRVQRVDRPGSRSFYVNLPVVLADALGVHKAKRSSGCWRTRTRLSSIVFNGSLCGIFAPVMMTQKPMLRDNLENVVAPNMI